MQTVRFEEGCFERSMTDRVKEAVERLQMLQDVAKLEGSTRELQPMQAEVFTDFIEFVEPALSRETLPLGRIVLPPRTGKTVIAGHIIRALGLTAVFLEPTQALVEQTALELELQLPGVLIAIHYGLEKQTTDHGIHVMTYHTLVNLFFKGTLPEEIRRSALIVADEGHKCMTSKRLQVLREAFDPQAIRFALTASPDYDDQRQLAHYFPYLIHEVLIREAYMLGLVAKMQAFVHEIDVDGSEVKMVQGDFSEEELGRLMSGGPFFEEVRRLRYDNAHNAKLGCLVVCKSQQQAYDLWKFLLSHRPKDTPEPALVLSDRRIVTTKKRRKALVQFNIGDIDTIIQVETLIEGWNAPRCKLLINLALSTSEVRSIQTFFRPLTLYKGLEARIHMIVPCNLPARFILPQELVMSRCPQSDYLSERERTLKGGTTGAPQPIKRRGVSPIEDVEVKSRIVMHVTLDRPGLNPKDADEVRSVIASCVTEFHPEDPPSLNKFRQLLFQHQLFQGRGDHLLRFLGIANVKQAYRYWLMNLYPDGTPIAYLLDHHERADIATCEEDARVLEEITRRYNGVWLRKNEVDVGWKTLFGEDASERDIDNELDHAALCHDLPKALGMLTPMEKRILLWYYNPFLEKDGELTLDKIAEKYHLSRERIRQLILRALEKLRRWYGSRL